MRFGAITMWESILLCTSLTAYSQMPNTSSKNGWQRSLMRRKLVLKKLVVVTLSNVVDMFEFDWTRGGTLSPIMDDLVMA